jgi:DNA polymerase I-like protein with 3'-5' exonuclease and polymerase domains
MNTWSIDTEYGFRGGVECPSAFTPVVFCAVEMDTGERRSFWGRDERLSWFIRDRAGDLFVSHNLSAEAQYLLRLGVQPPAHWFDTMLAWRYATNAQEVPPFGLEKALERAGIPHAYAGQKGHLQEWIGRLRFDPDSPEDRRLIRDYCLEDCVTTAALYRRLVGRVPATWMGSAVEYCLALARMELQGIALDMDRYTALLECKDEVVGRVTAQVNAVHPVFVRGQLSRHHFLTWCAANGIGWPTSWSPRTGRKTLSLDRRTFERMKGRHPFIQAVHEANKTARQLLDRALPVDYATGRHYPGSIPFGTATGRTSPRGSIFGAPKWMRWLVVPTSPEHLLVSVDFAAEEIGIAAHLSRDGNMTAGYASGDPHMAFAALAGAAPPGGSKKTHGAVRARYKAVNLGVNYGQTAFGVAGSTGMHLDEARALLAQHRRTYPDFWAWTDRYTTRAFARGVCYTAGGWPRKVGRQDNPRSVSNFAVQGTGGDLLRLATVYLTRLGVPLLATVHDSFVLECTRDQFPGLREAVNFALGRAVDQILPGSPMRWDLSVYVDRYRDEDGEPLWRLVERVLAAPTGGREVVTVG